MSYFSKHEFRKWLSYQTFATWQLKAKLTFFVWNMNHFNIINPSWHSIPRDFLMAMTTDTLPHSAKCPMKRNSHSIIPQLILWFPLQDTDVMFQDVGKYLFWMEIWKTAVKCALQHMQDMPNLPDYLEGCKLVAQTLLVINSDIVHCMHHALPFHKTFSFLKMVAQYQLVQPLPVKKGM